MQNRKYLALVLALSVVSLQAESVGRKQIGMVISSGSFTIDDVKSSGTATVFEGDQIETNTAVSRVHLASGTDFELSPHSSGTIYADHVVLNSGTVHGQIQDDYRLQAQNLVLKPTQKNTHAAVQIASAGVTVAVPAGSADIGTAQGMLLSHMEPGTALNYATSADAAYQSQTIKMYGVIDQHEDHYLIRDQYTNVVTELVGDVPTRDVNKLKMITGEVLDTKSTIPHVDRMVRIVKLDSGSAVGMGGPCALGGGDGGNTVKHIDLNGTLAKSGRHFLLTNSDQHVYEVLGDMQDYKIGTKVHIKAFVLEHRQPFSPAEQVVYAEDRKSFLLFASPCAGLVAGGMIITTGVLLIPSNDFGHHTPISF